MSSRKFRECFWILKTLKEEKRITLKRINELWMKDSEMSGGLPLDRRKFIRRKDDLKVLLGIDIICETDNTYSIINPDVLGEGKLAEWLLSTLAVDEKLKNCLTISSRIILEEIPSGGKKIDGITEAMIKHQKIRFSYMKYGDTKVADFNAEPYSLRLYDKRWYLLGRLENKKLYTFGLDRILNCDIIPEKFEMDPDFDAATYFSEFYGVFNSGQEIQKIIIRAFGTEVNYLRDKPIHKSQREIGSGEDFSDFLIELRPNNELIAFLLSRRNRLKVLSPDSILEEMKTAIEEMMALYN